VTDFVTSLWRDVAAQWRDLRERVGFWQPVAGIPPWMAPAVAIGALLALTLAAGLALASVATLLTALLVAHLVLTQVFGVSVALVPPR
jgi:hypothetical protein